MTNSFEWDKKFNIIDTDTPREFPLCGRYKQSFAYHTMRNRYPVIITALIDSLTRDKDELAEVYGEESREEVKTLIGKISKLKYQLQTDKRFDDFTQNEPDKALWNEFLAHITERTYFQANWLYAECYVYRRIYSFFEETETLKNYDYFGKQKIKGLTDATPTMEGIGSRLHSLEKSSDAFVKLLKLNLWGNRCDLSISDGKGVVPLKNLFDSLSTLDKNILADHSLTVWNFLTKTANKQTGEAIRVDFVLDNSGFELFTDLVLADYIIGKKLATVVCFHVKAMPWFISDVTERDFLYTLQWLKEHKSSPLSEMGKRWTKFVAEGKFKLEPLEYFWTSGYEYYKMRDVNPALYDRLAKSQLIIFKGDLNYRKLLGDVNWHYTEEFITCIRGFQPSNICTLRTLKADLICGLDDGVAETLNRTNPNWLINGDYGVIQCAVKEYCGCDA